MWELGVKEIAVISFATPFHIINFIGFNEIAVLAFALCIWYTVVATSGEAFINGRCSISEHTTTWGWWDLHLVQCTVGGSAHFFTWIPFHLVDNMNLGQNSMCRNQWWCCVNLLVHEFHLLHQAEALDQYLALVECYQTLELDSWYNETLSMSLLGYAPSFFGKISMVQWL